MLLDERLLHNLEILPRPPASTKPRSTLVIAPSTEDTPQAAHNLPRHKPRTAFCKHLCRQLPKRPPKSCTATCPKLCKAISTSAVKTGPLPPGHLASCSRSLRAALWHRIIRLARTQDARLRPTPGARRLHLKRQEPIRRASRPDNRQNNQRPTKSSCA